MPITRTSHRQPGFRCPDECRPECRGTAPVGRFGRHGQHDDEWYYAVSDGEVALSLRVFTNEYRNEPYPGNEQQQIRGVDLSVHLGWPNDHEAIRLNQSGVPCDYLDAKRCWSGYSSSLQAAEFFAAHGAPRFEQPETFWTALEAQFDDLAAAARKERPTVVRCNGCGGTGVVEPKADP